MGKPPTTAAPDTLSMGVWRALLSSSRCSRHLCSSRPVCTALSAPQSLRETAMLVTPASASRAYAHHCQASFSGRGSHRSSFASQAAVVEAPPEIKESTSTSTPNFATLPTSGDSEELLRIRHSCSHIMAMAVQRLFPGTQVTIGPWIEHGFFYDFDTPKPLSPQDLKAIQKDMRRIIRADLPFVREEVSKEEAEWRIKELGETYKLEILEGITARHPDASITIYHVGDESSEHKWWDLCAGPHVERTSNINPDALALESVAGAYWRGSEQNAMLQRIYGTAWRTKEELAAYNNFKVEAARRDHRKLGQQLSLFSISETAGPGLVFWHPKGAMVRHLIESFWKEIHLAAGYELVNSPHVAKTELWRVSGHYDFYKENMFDQMEVEGDSYQLKPMNCPFHIEIFKQGFYSYRDLPLRWAELGTVYRYERSGTMQGLFRVRGFTQDDAHIFCLPSQLTAEIRGALELVQKTMGAFGFTQLEVLLSTRPEKSVGTDAIWQQAEAALQDALVGMGWQYAVNEADGAFYGPKIDINIRDAIGRRWQCSTIQLDFNLPERFKMEYVDQDQQRRQPIMLHRAIFGSIERFFGILLENYAGAFPLWLAPVQVRLLCVTDQFGAWANETAQRMRESGLRVEVLTGERISKHIRNAEKAKTPVMCVVGQNEVDSGNLAVRTYHGGDQGSMAIDDVISRVLSAVKAKSSFS